MKSIEQRHSICSSSTFCFCWCLLASLRPLIIIASIIIIVIINSVTVIIGAVCLLAARCLLFVVCCFCCCCSFGLYLCRRVWNTCFYLHAFLCCVLHFSCFSSLYPQRRLLSLLLLFFWRWRRRLFEKNRRKRRSRQRQTKTGVLMPFSPEHQPAVYIHPKKDKRKMQQENKRIKHNAIDCYKQSK